MLYALVLRDGPNSGLFVAPHEIEDGDPGWQPPPGFSSDPLVAIVDPPAYVGEGWFFRDSWQLAVPAAGSGSYGGWRVPTDAEILERAILARAGELQIEVSRIIDAGIFPATLNLLQVGVLDDTTAEAVRVFIGDVYREANRVLGLLETVESPSAIDDILPVWPEYIA